MTHMEIVNIVDRMAETNKVVKIILSNICGDGYDAYERAYNIICAITN